MIEQLFGSKTRVKLLQLFYTNPNRSFYVREITRKIDEQINSVRRELANLLSVGIIKSDANNNRLYYEVNQAYEYYAPLAMIFGGVTVALPTGQAGKTPKKAAKTTAAKTTSAVSGQRTDVAPEHPMAKAVRSVGKVDLAILTGQFTRDDRAGVDVLIVGDINQSKADKFITELEKAENKELSYTTMPLATYEYRLQIKDRFINDVLEAKKQVIINTQDLPI
ncbi:transcriptional regulator [Candidatus Saccharibacteria bacterium]|nr:transcriptional regulator [Candidatus Saccharibacteria bacterium]